MNKTYIVLKAIAAVSAAACCGLGGVCLYGYISDEKRRKQKMEQTLLKETVRQLFYDVNELKYHIQFQEKKIKS